MLFKKLLLLRPNYFQGDFLRLGDSHSSSIDNSHAAVRTQIYSLKPNRFSSSLLSEMAKNLLTKETKVPVSYIKINYIAHT